MCESDRESHRAFLQPPEYPHQHGRGCDGQDQFRCRLGAGETIQGSNSVPDKQCRDLQHKLSQKSESQGFLAQATSLEHAYCSKIHS